MGLPEETVRTLSSTLKVSQKAIHPQALWSKDNTQDADLHAYFCEFMEKKQDGSWESHSLHAAGKKAEPSLDKWEFMSPEEREVAALSKKLNNLMAKLADTWEESKD